MVADTEPFNVSKGKLFVTESTLLGKLFNSVNPSFDPSNECIRVNVADVI